MATNQNQEAWGDDEWDNILLHIMYGECTPFLGAGACAGTLPLGSEIAEDWARKHEYPLENIRDLAQVAQFRAVKHGSTKRPKLDIKALFEKVVPPDFKKPDEPHGVLADLPLPIYITTNYDDFMMQALKSRNKDPERILCQWNEIVKDAHSSIFETEPGFKPTDQRPVVFHLHGNIDMPASMVLTEDDYLDFLVNISKEQTLIPPRIQRAIKSTLLLFLGYQLADLDFRVIFRSLLRDIEKSVSETHVSVQLIPGGDAVSSHQIKQMQAYLDKYFGQLHTRVYWGTCREFVKELSSRWEAYISEK